MKIKKSPFVVAGFLAQLLSTETQAEQISQHLDSLKSKDTCTFYEFNEGSLVIDKLLKKGKELNSNMFQKVHLKGLLDD